MMADLRERVLVQRVDGGPDLVHLGGGGVRLFLSHIDELVAADTILAAALLAGEAFRYGRPPVILRLRFVGDGSFVRVEVDDQQPFWADTRPHGCRGGLLGRLDGKGGLRPAGDGTRTWVEIAVVPKAYRAPGKRAQETDM